jgi:exopolysaccharide biosynthesis polyprenyl glycosylphosphotransferase
MLRRDQQLRIQLLQLKDAALFMLSLLLAYWLRENLGSFVFLEMRPLATFDQFAWLYLIIFPGAPLVLESQGFYRRSLFCPRSETAWLLFKSCALVTAGVILVMFFFKMHTLNRLVIILFGMVSFVLTYASEELLRWLYGSQFAQAQIRKRVLVVGTPEDTERMKSELMEKAAGDSIEVVGEVDINNTTIDQLVERVHQRSPNGVILCAKHTYFGQVEQAIQACEREGVEVWLVAEFFRTQISRTSFDELMGRPVMVFRTVPETSWQGLAKQVIDFVATLISLAVLAPLVLLPVALIIKLTSPGPVFFRQRRAGLNGQPFTMLKFRSMVTDAEQRKVELDALNEMTGPVFKVTNDPRVTSIGRVLRRFSIDELPQLVNVLRGEMSLVGPRPLPVDEVERFDDPSHRRRLSVKPGLTCLWQVSGRNEVRDFKEWVRLDLEYIDNWSLWLDLKILWRTIPAVFMGTGAK